MFKINAINRDYYPELAVNQHDIKMLDNTVINLIMPQSYLHKIGIDASYFAEYILQKHD
jgi:hypothetical protein